MTDLGGKTWSAGLIGAVQDWPRAGQGAETRRGGRDGSIGRLHRRTAVHGGQQVDDDQGAEQAQAGRQEAREMGSNLRY